MVPLLALAFSISGAVPHRELPSTFVGGRVFVMPRVENHDRRLVLWVDSNGNGFLRSGVVSELKLQTGPADTAYLPALGEPGFPAVNGNHGALPVLNDARVASDPVFSGIDGQLGWTWLDGRIWTIDYPGRHLYQDYTAPAYREPDRVPLLFDRAHRYPQMGVTIAGIAYRAALDTGASIALSQAALQTVHDGLPQVRAASFVRRSTLQSWHAAHPDWTYVANAGTAGEGAMIRVPEVSASRVVFRNVWFSTRPDDDVFAGEALEVKLGPSAFDHCAVTLDYVHDEAGFECAGSINASP